MSDPMHSPSEVPLMPGSTAPLAPLSVADAQILAEHLAAATKSQAPLGPALRAAAAELPQRRLSSAMIRLAGELEAGRSLDSILANNPRFLPPHMQRLIETGVRAGNLPEVLVRLIDIDRTSSDLQRSIRIALAYPIVLIVLWLCLLAYFGAQVVPDLLRTLHGFKTELPLPTRLLAALSGKWMLRTLGFLAAALPMLFISFRILRRPLGWQRMLNEIPLWGPTLLWRGVASWCRLLALILRQDIPLPEALRLASNGIYAPIPMGAGLRAARVVETGKKLSDALGMSRLMPATLLPFVRWGEDHNTLPEALDSAADMFEHRVQMRAALMRNVFPPVVFISIALGALWIANAMIMPMVMLMRGLSVGLPKGRSGGPLSADTLEERIILGIAILIGVWFVTTILIVLIRSTLGSFLFMLTRRNTDSGRIGRWDTLLSMCRAGYWILSLLVLLIVMSTLAGVAGFFLWLVALAIIVMFVVRFGEMERRSLLWLLAVAMEKGVPLGNAAHAFADERRDRLGRKTRRLAIALQGGAPLDRAVDTSRISLPTDALVAVRVGSNLGGLPELLKSVNGGGALADAATQAATGRATYLVFLIIFTAVPLTFLSVRIFPAYQKIFADFKTEMPETTVAVMNAVEDFAYSPALPLLACGMLATLFYVVGRYCGLIHWDAPIVRAFTLKLDQGLVMRALAECVARKQPIPRMLGTLADQYPKSHIRRRLWRAAQSTVNGTNWCDALTRVGMLPRADAKVLKAAERVGNLPWALNETAERLSRRFTTRVMTATAILFPIVLVALGSVTFFASVGMILPLSKLITKLTP
jgi:type II secretory pathway component PulF